MLLTLHLSAGVRHDAEQLAWNCPVGRRLPGFDAPQSRPEILQVVFSSLPPCTASLSPALLPHCVGLGVEVSGGSWRWCGCGSGACGRRGLNWSRRRWWVRRSVQHAELRICVDSWRVRLRCPSFFTRAPCAPPAAHTLDPFGDALDVAGLVEEAAWQCLMYLHDRTHCIGFSRRKKETLVWKSLAMVETSVRRIGTCRASGNRGLLTATLAVCACPHLRGSCFLSFVSFVFSSCSNGQCVVVLPAFQALCSFDSDVLFCSLSIVLDVFVFLLPLPLNFFT